MKKRLMTMVAWALTVIGAVAQFEVSAVREGAVVRVDVVVPADHYLYSNAFMVTDGAGNPQKALEMPEPLLHSDPLTGMDSMVYETSFTGVFAWEPSADGAGEVRVAYMGCNNEICFAPKTWVLELGDVSAAAGDVAPEAADTEAAERTALDWQEELAMFERQGVEVGYKSVSAFLDFMEFAENGANAGQSRFARFLKDPGGFVRQSGLGWTIFFILIGGLALNLTPCVLPMIPINLAIIGAGAQAGSKRRGFALGGLYGLGIALAYGLLGVVVVLTGSQFGAIQSNPWFNFGIAGVFVVLALAMFDVIQVDLSRFQSRVGGPRHAGRYAVAFSMGAVAALLAGACVAPVVIAVLALSTSVYEVHPAAGLALPFVLGLGMALPWPFAGAGLSFLPKPGKWMVYVKYVFGIGILVFALYYAQLGYRGFRPAPVAEAEEAGKVVVDGSTNEGFAAALADARAEGRPVFIDFWAHTCKNCKAMDVTTFRDPAVAERLADYVFIKYVADRFDDPDTKAVLDWFEVQGLPTYVVLAPQVP